MKSMTSIAEMEAAVNSPTPVWIFKHSRVCPVSFAAHQEVMDYVAARPSVDVRILVVQDARPVSTAVAERTGVKHESPQALLVRGGKVLWHGSHQDITEAALEEAASKIA
jgi:bacillithiol system protein YtxJ